MEVGGDEKAEGDGDVAPRHGVVGPRQRQAEVFVLGTVVVAALGVDADLAGGGGDLLQEAQRHPAAAVVLEEPVLVRVVLPLKVQFLIDAEISGGNLVVDAEEEHLAQAEELR